MTAVHLVVALLPEAKPLIEHFRLKASNTSPFKIYGGDAVHLIISGVGKTRSAAAVVFLYEHSGRTRNSIWLNIGLGGHSDFEIGTGFLAHKITDQASSRSWHPPQIKKPPCGTAAVLTVGRPEANYAQPCVYEMEAAGFYETATRFSTSELIQCFKVISDNRTTGPNLSGEQAERLIANQTGTIEKLMEDLKALTRRLPAPFRSKREFERIAKRWHFTVTQRHQLVRILERLKTLEASGEILNGDFEGLRSASEVLQALERRMALVPVKL